jgi:hypothetical protein
MASNVVRLDLPSGNWWEIETRPNWGDMMKIRREMVRLTEDESPDEDQLTAVMTMLTRAWSYTNGSEDTPLPISIESINEMDIMDAAEVMHKVNQEVIPLLVAVGEQQQSS